MTTGWSAFRSHPKDLILPSLSPFFISIGPKIRSYITRDCKIEANGVVYVFLCFLKFCLPLCSVVTNTFKMYFKYKMQSTVGKLYLKYQILCSSDLLKIVTLCWRRWRLFRALK